MSDTEAIRAKACLDALTKTFRMAIREGGKDAKMHVGDVLQLIEAFHRGDFDEDVSLTGPFYPRGVQ